MTEETLNAEEEIVGQPPLEDMPMDRPLKGVISEVTYRVKMYLGKTAFLTNFETKEPVLDSNGNKIPQKEFNMKISIPEFKMNNGQARIVWLSLGSALGPKAKLSNFLARIGCEVKGGTPAQEIIDKIMLKEISFILCKKKPDSKYQTPMLETIQAVKA